METVLSHCYGRLLSPDPFVECLTYFLLPLFCCRVDISMQGDVKTNVVCKAPCSTCIDGSTDCWSKNAVAVLSPSDCRYTCVEGAPRVHK